jgi:hypothetical protein
MKHAARIRIEPLAAVHDAAIVPHEKIPDAPTSAGH